VRFEAAHRAERQVQATIWTAHTELAWARSLQARRGPSDRARAALLVTNAADFARTCELPALLEASRDVEAGLCSGGARGARPRRQVGPV
jgi:hypothetical protein